MFHRGSWICWRCGAYTNGGKAYLLGKVCAGRPTKHGLAVLARAADGRPTDTSGRHSWPEVWQENVSAFESSSSSCKVSLRQAHKRKGCCLGLDEGETDEFPKVGENPEGALDEGFFCAGVPPSPETERCRIDVKGGGPALTGAERLRALRERVKAREKAGSSGGL